MFFIYPAFLLIALTGLENIISRTNLKPAVIYSLTGIYMAYILYVEIRLHPYQNVYFNLLAGNNIEDTRENFEIDYWGLSYREGIKYILSADTSSHIIIGSFDLPGEDNIKMFPEKERARVSFTREVELSDYFMTVYRNHHDPYDAKDVFSVERAGGKLMSVFKINGSVSVLNEKFRVASFKNNYEDKNGNWSSPVIITDGNSYSGTHAEILDSSIEYSGGFVLYPPEILTGIGAGKYATVSFWMKSAGAVDTRIIFQVDSGNTVYDWHPYNIYYSQKNTWVKCEYRLPLSTIHSAKDKISIYVWNNNRNNFLIDDMEINFYVIPEPDYKKIIDPLKSIYYDSFQYYLRDFNAQNIWDYK